MPRLRSALVVLAASLLLLPNPEAWAWGSEGHGIIADVAWHHLTPATRDNLQPFLEGGDLASISAWADDIRPGRPETAPWHYVNIPPDSSGYDPKDCPNDNCVVAQINKFAQILGDPSQPLAARTEALKFLVHFVGDLSQPLHAAADARGGNDVPVTAFGAARCSNRPCNLHSVWDSELIAHTGLDQQGYVKQLEKMITADHLQAGSDDPVTWANESWQLAKQAWVQPQSDIEEAYYQRERPVVDRQLALAGLRLARLLNKELGGGSQS
jgi:S1/P1 Nuclease